MLKVSYLAVVSALLFSVGCKDKPKVIDGKQTAELVCPAPPTCPVCKPCPGDDAGPPPPPPPATGKVVSVTLKPSATGTQWVSFGLPLPPGQISDVTKVSVKDSTGVEIKAFTKSLGNWQSIPPAELLCSNLTPTFPGVRSVLVQFQKNFTSTSDVKISVEVGGTVGQKLAAGVDVRSTMKIVNDGRLYFGTENVREPKVYAAVDNKWLACTGINTLSGLADQSTTMAKIDAATKNFFYTAIKDYRSAWDAASGSWPVNATYDHVDLYAPVDGTWLYQRSQTFYNQYIRTGIFDMLREAHHAASHYSTLIYTDADCVNSQWKDWCVGFFKIKNTDPNSSWKDFKYSYGEDIATYYWMTGDTVVLPLLKGITSATKKVGAEKSMQTERFTSVALAAPVYEYEVTGDATLLPYIKSMVDYLQTLQNKPNAEGEVTGCFPGNDEFGETGFSPWMTPLMTHSLLRIYFTTKDSRIPGMLAKSAQCLTKRGMAYTSSVDNKRMLIPFYGGTNTGTPRDLDGDNPWAGVEHSLDVANGVAIGYLYETDATKKAALKTALTDLIISGEWVINYWTRTTAGSPKYRVSPWRKFNWWFKNIGALQWALFGKPTLK